MKGDGSGLQEDRIVTRAEALVMLSRAFGDLPEPVGDSARWAYPAANYTDLPDWAVQDLEHVFASGIVAGTSATTFSPDDPITDAELDTFIRRVYAIEGTNLKDDFYATNNREWLRSTEMPAGYSVYGTTTELTYQVEQQVSEIIQEIVKATPKDGTSEAKIKALYETILDWDARNEAGVAPIQSYLDEIDAAASLKELMAVHNKITVETGVSPLFPTDVGIDAKDSTQYLADIGIAAPSLSKDYYTDEEHADVCEALKTYFTTLFTLSGEDAERAAQDAALVFDMEKTLAAAMMDQQDYLNVDKVYNVFTAKQLQAKLPNIDLAAFMESVGFHTDRIQVVDVGLLEAGAAYLDDSHLDTLKAAVKVGLLKGIGGTLSRDFSDAADQFDAALTGGSDEIPDDQIASRLVQEQMSDYLGKAYVERHFSAEAKQDVTSMIHDILKVYKERILALDWMSDTTRQRAVEKLEAITVKVGYPNSWDTYLDEVTFKRPSEGGTYFDNYT
ncbi:MAG: hypothetical protein HFE97_11325, partial [Oscillospiraceae bacterium]|nr:hypothetical protein [Oscillospiraceae bacterium]